MIVNGEIGKTWESCCYLFKGNTSVFPGSSEANLKTAGPQVDNHITGLPLLKHKHYKITAMFVSEYTCFSVTQVTLSYTHKLTFKKIFRKNYTWYIARYMPSHLLHLGAQQCHQQFQHSLGKWHTALFGAAVQTKVHEQSSAVLQGVGFHTVCTTTQALDQPLHNTQLYHPHSLAVPAYTT
jgi:hypothetical protein